MWAKIKKFFKDSETIFWARFQVLMGAVVAGLLSLVNDPNVGDAIKSVLKPEYVPYYVIAFGVITEIARRRRATDL